MPSGAFELGTGDVGGDTDFDGGVWRPAVSPDTVSPSTISPTSASPSSAPVPIRPLILGPGTLGGNSPIASSLRSDASGGNFGRAPCNGCGGADGHVSQDPGVVVDQIANAAEANGISRDTLQRLVANKIGGAAAGVLSRNHQAAVLGVEGLAAALRTSPAALLSAAGVKASSAISAGLSKATRSAAAPQARRVAPRHRGLGAIDFGSADDQSASGSGGEDDGGVPVSGKAVQSTGDGFPAAPGYRPGNWDFSAGQYTLAMGDTLSGLARLYLGSPSRWQEIWTIQDSPPRFVLSPDKLPTGQKLNMPQEATDRATAMLGKKPAVPSSIGKKAPVKVAGEDPNAPMVNGGTSAGILAKIPKPLLYAGAAAAVLGVGYAVVKS